MRQALVRISSFSRFSLFCSLTVGLCLSLEAQDQNPAKQASASKEAGLVEMTVTVSDPRGRCLKGLNKDNLLVQVDDAHQPIVHFNAHQEPVSIVFLIDTSGSMQTRNSKMSLHGLAAKSIQQTLSAYNRPDEFSVVVFSRDVQLALGWTRERDEVLKCLANVADVKPKGQTAFRNAVSFGIELFKSGTNSRRIVVIFSDALDTSADAGVKSVPYKQLLQILRRTGVLVYSVNLRALGTNAASSVDASGANILYELAKASGGKTFEPVDVVGGSIATRQILMETRCQYSIEFKPNHPTAASDKLHKVKIELSPSLLAESGLKGLKVHHRDGYYWPPNN